MNLELIEDINSRTEAIKNAADETMDTICSHLASGGSLIDLCEVWKVRYGDVSSWIRKDKERNIRYNNAIIDQCEWARDRILVELRRIGTADIRKLFTDEGVLIPVHEWPSDVSSFISSMDVSTEFETTDGKKEAIGTVTKFKMWNKEKALELLGKNLHMFMERVEHSGKVTLEDLITQSRDDMDEPK